MIILPERIPSRDRPLKPASIQNNNTFWRLTARLHDGYVLWQQWFEDRLEADFAIGQLTPGLVYDLASVTFLTSTSGSNQSWSAPSDWSDSNTIEIIAGGGSTPSPSGPVNGASGGGGGEYRKSVNLTGIAQGASVLYRLEGTATPGATAGKDAWFNSVAFPTTGQACGAHGGGGGTVNGTGGSGGTGGYSIGTGNSGSNGGSGTTTATNRAGGGGGGAGGPNSAGGNGGSPTGSVVAEGGGGGGGAGGGGAGVAQAGGSPAGITTGGNGGQNAGGTGSGGIGGTATVAGGAGVNGNGGGGGGSAGNGGVGGSGTDWSVSFGAGGGGGGGGTNSGLDGAGASAGSYGGGAGGGAGGVLGGTSGNGAQGLIVITYNPLIIPSIINASEMMSFRRIKMVSY